MTDGTTKAAPELPAWVDAFAQSRAGIMVLSVMESSVLPIPLEAILIPLMVSRPRRAMPLALWALIGCVLGSALLYGAGHLFADPIVLPVVDALGQQEAFAEVQDELQSDSLFWTAFLLSVSPAPIQLASLGAGVIGGAPLIFLAAIAASRGLRYFGMALLAVVLGPRLEALHLPVWAVLVASFVTVLLIVLAI